MKKLGLISLAVLTTAGLAACGNGGGSLTEEQLACQAAITTYSETLVASTEGTVVEDGDRAVVDYVGRLSDHEVFDTSIEAVASACGQFNENRDYSEGLPFLVGQGQMIAGFEDAVRGMKVGESKSVTLSPEEAYGERTEDNVVAMPKAELPEGDWKAGDELPTFFGPMPIIEVSEDEVKIDTNHPLAGETLIFDITIKSVDKAADIQLPEEAPAPAAVEPVAEAETGDAEVASGTEG